MKKAMLTIGAVALTLIGAANAFAGPPQKCVSADIPLIVEVLPVDGPCPGDPSQTCNVSALGGDNEQLIGGNSVYVDGERGVYNLRINGCSGTFDATFGLVTSNDRVVLMTFPPKVAGSTSPTWVGTGPFVAKPYMNVRDILWGRRNGSDIFTTQMSMGYIQGPGDRSDYQLRFQNKEVDPLTKEDSLRSKTSYGNEAGTVKVTVVDTPATCPSFDSWEVSPVIDATNGAVGALYKTKTGAPGRPLQHALQDEIHDHDLPPPIALSELATQWPQDVSFSGHRPPAVGCPAHPHGATVPGSPRGASRGDLFDHDAFLVRLDVSGRWLEYSTDLGATGQDEGLGITGDADGAVFPAVRTLVIAQNDVSFLNAAGVVRTNPRTNMPSPSSS